MPDFVPSLSDQFGQSHVHASIDRGQILRITLCGGYLGMKIASWSQFRPGQKALAALVISQ
jgi:hypothetical protein